MKRSLGPIHVFVAPLILGSVLAALVAVSLSGRRPAPAQAAPVVGVEEAAKAAGKPFEPPPLEALKGVKWVPQRVVDSLQLLRDHLKTKQRLATDEEALRLTNSDEQTNARIASAFGRLPESEEEVDWDATIVRYLPGEPNSLNYILNSTMYEANVNTVLNAGLFGFDWNLVPLADSETVVEWSTSEDHMMDRVVLRDDMTWTDGVPFTAHDVEFSFNTIRSPRVPCPALRTGTDTLKGVKAYDDRTLVFFHREPLTVNIWALNFQVIPKHIFQPTLARDPTMVQSDEHNRLNRNPITSGAYRFVSWSPQEIVCERRPEWYERGGKRIRQKPYFKTIRFRIIQERNSALLAFKKGELDEMEITADQWHDQTTGQDFYARGTKIAGEEWSFYFLGWNQKPIPDAPFFRDQRVREAMSYAFPHQEFLTKICHGLYRPAPSMFHPSAWMADPGMKPLQQDFGRAKRLLTEAGWKDTDGDSVLDNVVDGRKVDFRFTLTIPSGNPLYSKISALLKRDLEKLGVICNIRELEFATVIAESREHKFQANCFGVITGTDPDTQRNFWTTEAYKFGRNYVAYSNPKVDELFDRAQREFDRSKRTEVYREISRIVTGEFPYTFLCFRASFFAVSRNLRGINFSPKGPFNFSPGLSAIWKKKG